MADATRIIDSLKTQVGEYAKANAILGVELAEAREALQRAAAREAQLAEALTIAGAPIPDPLEPEGLMSIGAVEPLPTSRQERRRQARAQK